MTAPFAVQADQNPYLAAGATRVDAVVTVTATGTGAAADALEIVVVDVSGSMAGEKIRAARRATAVAIGELRDGVAITGPGRSTRTSEPPGPTTGPAPRPSSGSASCGPTAAPRSAPGCARPAGSPTGTRTRSGTRSC